MPTALPSLRWMILGPIVLTGLVLGLGVAMAPSAPPLAGLLRTAVRLFFALSFLLIGVALTYGLFVDGLGMRS